jgi:hypothetical protein
MLSKKLKEKLLKRFRANKIIKFKDNVRKNIYKLEKDEENMYFIIFKRDMYSKVGIYGLSPSEKSDYNRLVSLKRDYKKILFLVNSRFIWCNL